MQIDMEKSLKQYIDLYNGNREELDAHSAHVLNALRSDACAVLSDMTLPAAGSENYEVIDLPAMLGHGYGVNLCL